MAPDRRRIADRVADLAGYDADVDREKLSLYRVYLYLIMLVEGTPRGYTGARHEGVVKLVESHLLTELSALEQGS